MMIRLAPSLAALALLAWGSAALAGGVSPVPAVNGFQGRVVIPGSVNSAGAISSLGGGVGMNVGNADGVSVQTNINASRNVQAGTNVTINETINGVQVGYGMGGDFLAGADAQAQTVWAQKQALYQQLENEASLAVQVWQPGN